jgi:hypothetical protein
VHHRLARQLGVNGKLWANVVEQHEIFVDQLDRVPALVPRFDSSLVTVICIVIILHNTQSERISSEDACVSSNARRSRNSTLGENNDKLVCFNSLTAYEHNCVRTSSLQFERARFNALKRHQLGSQTDQTRTRESLCVTTPPALNTCTLEQYCF